jgi:SAP domain-containing ribonucleoprotein
LSVEGLKADLVNRLQARLDEEEFGMVDAPVELPSEGGNVAATEDEEDEMPVAAATVEVEEVKPEEEVKPAEDFASPENTGAPEVTTTVVTPAESKTAISFLDKKKSRAARFGIPVVEKTAAEPNGGKKEAKKDDPKRKKAGTETEEGNKKPKNAPDVEEEMLLSKAEIEKRIQRAQKFGTGNKQELDRLKSMLRKHRFSSTGE